MQDYLQRSNTFKVTANTQQLPQLSISSFQKFRLAGKALYSHKFDVRCQPTTNSNQQCHLTIETPTFESFGVYESFLGRSRPTNEAPQQGMLLQPRRRIDGTLCPPTLPAPVQQQPSAPKRFNFRLSDSDNIWLTTLLSNIATAVFPQVCTYFKTHAYECPRMFTKLQTLVDDEGNVIDDKIYKEAFKPVFQDADDGVGSIAWLKLDPQCKIFRINNGAVEEYDINKNEVPCRGMYKLLISPKSVYLGTHGNTLTYIASLNLTITQIVFKQLGDLSERKNIGRPSTDVPRQLVLSTDEFLNSDTAIVGGGEEKAGAKPRKRLLKKESLFGAPPKGKKSKTAGGKDMVSSNEQQDLDDLFALYKQCLQEHLVVVFNEMIPKDERAQYNHMQLTCYTEVFVRPKEFTKAV